MRTLSDLPVRTRWLVAVVLAAAVLALSFTTDQPVERWVVAHRSPSATSFFRAATHLGDPAPMFVLGLVLAACAAFRSARLALAVLVATLARPLLSTALKNLFDRQRPDLGQLVQASGDSFPSGHALAATVAWGCLPLVMLAWRAGRDLVRPAVVVAVLVVLTVAASRVYLGVHWVSDVVAGVLLGALVLALVRVAARRP